MRRTGRLPTTECVIARPLRGTLATAEVALVLATAIDSSRPTRVAAISAQVAMRLIAEIAAIRAATHTLAACLAIAARRPVQCCATFTRTASRRHR